MCNVVGNGRIYFIEVSNVCIDIIGIVKLIVRNSSVDCCFYILVQGFYYVSFRFVFIGFCFIYVFILNRLSVDEVISYYVESVYIGNFFYNWSVVIESISQVVMQVLYIYVNVFSESNVVVVIIFEVYIQFEIMNGERCDIQYD